jgi:3-oxoacyl-[acyl-carrier protein] reductase
MPITLSGKTAIVTGGGRGIGKAIATIFAREGAKVLVVNRSAGAGQNTTEAILAEGNEASFLQADVKSQADMERMAAECIARYSRIDILCLNAGIFPNSLIADMSEAMWDDVMDTNLKGVFFATQACMPQMKSQKSGRLLVVSSITGPHVGLPDVSCYMASKGGVNAFVKGAALELAPYNITANTVSPGTIMTEGIAAARGPEEVEKFNAVIPAGYIGAPEDVAYALLFLASDQARYVTGHDIVLDGGQILPERPQAL